MSSIHVHSERSARTEAPARAFWDQVDKSGDCWIWQGGLMSKGYGHFSHEGEKELAHRQAYILEHGGVPSGRVVDHTCHNILCVRPAHLRAAANKQNLENRAGAQVNSRSGVRGVYWDEFNSKWRAKVQHNGKVYHAGRFDTIEEATQAAIAKRIELFTHNDMDRIEAAA
jgi:hypothetical protein